MLDFYRIVTEIPKSNRAKSDFIIYPDFRYGKVKDLICKGGTMYAFWWGGKWNDDLNDLIKIIDNDIYNKKESLEKETPGCKVTAKLIESNSSKLMRDLKEYTKLFPQSEVQFNTSILYSNVTPKREDYSTAQLSYTPKEGPTPAFDEMFNLLYETSELEKILWFIGALLTNNMKHIQKFLYLYGGKGTGKGTIIKVIQMIFQEYWSPIDLSNLASDSDFATSEVKEVPLLIDEDTDLTNIRKDINLLKLTAHEPLIINAKYKQTYSLTFEGLLIAASNQRYKVRNIDSGITRRAVVARPTNDTHNFRKYNELIKKIKFELPMIAQKAIDLFENKGMSYYEDYVDYDMVEATDYMYSFVREYALALNDECSLKRAAELYKIYLEDLGYDTKGYKRKIRQELTRYYQNFHDQKKIDGKNVKNIFEGFKWDIVFPEKEKTSDVIKKELSIKELIDKNNLFYQRSEFDKVGENYQAQLASEKGTPSRAWDKVNTILKNIDTEKLHYVRVPLNHIVIDFDLKDEEGNKCLERNLQASSAYPNTYMEVSKSGRGIHLHYIYDGKPEELAPIIKEDIEIKVFSGKSSLRRQLSMCNDLEIAHISSGLPLKKEEEIDLYKDIEFISWNEKKLRNLVKGNLEKKYHANTKPSIDFIAKVFKDAENDGLKYDLRDLRQDILVFAMSSSNNKDYCLEIVNKIKYSTIEENDAEELQKGGKIISEDDICFYDVEVFPNLFVVVYKRRDSSDIVKLINPSPLEIEKLIETECLVGFNNRRYDNHILYARMLGEDLNSLYRQSQRIINDKNAGSGMYSGAYELSYADIYEYSSKKQSLKKWEIDLGIKHDELDLPWDKPVDESMWERVADYCVNDVVATEATFDATIADYQARLILATLSGLSVNATTTQHAAGFIFGNDPRPQDKFNYTDLSKDFKGYEYSYGKSSYRGEDPGEGGYVYAEPGVYKNVGLFDVESMHPRSLIEMDYFGPYTKVYSDLVTARLYIKHDEFEEAGKMFNGSLKPFLKDKSTAKQLSYALKIIINIVYGMTSAKFDNKFKHPKNVDNIVAKRGALFMIDLKHAVQEQGYEVAHIKTDSIKVPNTDDKIKKFIFEFGKKYGYTFEHEETYSRLALINKSTYICENLKGEWSATGAQYKEPYVFKRLFEKSEINKEDFFLVKQVKNASVYLGDNFVGRLGEVYASKTGKEMYRVVDDKTSYISGTKGHLWKLSSEYVDKSDVDLSYYEGLVSKAKDAIEKVGDSSVMLT